MFKLSPETIAKIRAAVAIACTAFAGGVGASIEAQITSNGIPPESQWQHILVTAIAFGAVAAWHRLQASPPDVAASLRRAAVISTTALCFVLGLAFAVVVAACGAFGGVVTPSISVGTCLIQVGRAQSYADFPAFFAAAWKACKGLVEADAVALLTAIVETADPTIAQYAPMARAHLADAEARASLVRYAKANAGER